MAQLSRTRLDDYDEQLTKIADTAGKRAEAEYLAWHAQNLNADVAEIRNHIIELIDGVLDSYGDAACELSARLYDEQAEKAGADVSPADLPEVSDEMKQAIERRAHYVVGQLVDEREDI